MPPRYADRRDARAVSCRSCGGNFQDSAPDGGFSPSQGWFGFNGGAATTAEQAGLIWINTLVAPAAAMLSWLVTEKIRHGHPTSLGAASGVVAGLVAITPSCANISQVAAIGLGLVAGAACAIFVDLKYRFGLDDSLDVVGVTWAPASSAPWHWASSPFLLTARAAGSSTAGASSS